MGKPLRIERIGDMFRLLWLESVITEASQMTRNIKLHSILMNWMCFHCRSGGLCSPQPKPKIFEMFSKISKRNEKVYRRWLKHVEQNINSRVPFKLILFQHFAFHFVISRAECHSHVPDKDGW